MKTKLSIFFLLCSFAGFAQLDTMMIRPAITLTGGDWCLLRGLIGTTKDSATLRSDRSVHAQIVGIANVSYATVIPIDSIPAKVVLAFWLSLRTAKAYLVDDRYATIRTALQTATQLNYWFGFYDAMFTKDKNEVINSGKNFYVDQ